MGTSTCFNNSLIFQCMLLLVLPRTVTAWVPSTPFALQHPSFKTARELTEHEPDIVSDAENLAKDDLGSKITGVTLKIALDANGGVAEGDPEAPSVRFTCDNSLDMVHRLRRDSDAVLVGRGTVERDDCSLTVRRVPSQMQPTRVILDPRLSLLLNELNDGSQYQVLTDEVPTIIYHAVDDVDMTSLRIPDFVSLVCIPASEELPEGARPGRYVSPQAVLDNLRSVFNIHHVMVEGGPQTALFFLEDNLIDRAIIVRAPIEFEEPIPSGITEDSLKGAGLEMLGSIDSGVDTIDCWARKGESWPTSSIGDWP